MSAKVLIICQNFYPEIGSAANRMKNVYLELVKRGYEVTVLTSEPSYPNRNLYKNSAFWQDDDFQGNVIRFTTKTRKYSKNLFNRLRLYVEMTYRIIGIIGRLDKEFDVVIATTPNIFIGLTGVYAKWRLRCPLVLDIRDLWPDSLLGIGAFTFKPIIKLASLIEKKIYQSAKHIIVNSEGFIPHLLSKNVKKKKISFMPNSLSDEELAAVAISDLKDVEKDLITVAYTGNIGLAQDLNVLLRVAENMLPYKNVEFIILGYGFRSKELEQLIKEKKLYNIELLKPKSRNDAVAITAAADIAFVTLVDKPVFDTVLPGKIVDYMCIGKPIVGAVSGYAAEMVEKANCGFISRDRSEIEIQKYILELSENPGLRKKFGDNGKEFAYQNFRWSKNIKILTTLLEREYEEKSVHVRVESLHQ